MVNDTLYKAYCYCTAQFLLVNGTPLASSLHHGVLEIATRSNLMGRFVMDINMSFRLICSALMNALSGHETSIAKMDRRNFATTIDMSTTDQHSTATKIRYT